MSSTISEAISRLTTIRDNIRTALANKGATGTSSMNMEDFPTAIINLPSGIRAEYGRIDLATGTTAATITITNITDFDFLHWLCIPDATNTTYGGSGTYFPVRSAQYTSTKAGEAGTQNYQITNINKTNHKYTVKIPGVVLPGKLYYTAIKMDGLTPV